MTAADLIRAIGISHLLQPPLTYLLAQPRGIDLRASLVAKTPLAAEVLTNMASAAVCLPTLLGALIACYPMEVLHPGPARSLGALLSLFWCWRLYRQWFVLRPLWPRSGRAAWLLQVLLTLIFVMQGPGLGLLVIR